MLYWHQTQWCSNWLFSLNTLQRFDKLKSIIRDFHQTLHHTTKDIFFLELWNFFFFSSVFYFFFYQKSIILIFSAQFYLHPLTFLAPPRNNLRGYIVNLIISVDRIRRYSKYTLNASHLNWLFVQNWLTEIYSYWMKTQQLPSISFTQQYFKYYCTLNHRSILMELTLIMLCN